MSAKARTVRPGWDFNPYKRFDWDHPSEGMRFPRTLEEAFGPGAKLHQPQPLLTPTRACYALAALLVFLTGLLLLVA